MVLNQRYHQRLFSAFGYTLSTSEIFSPWLEESHGHPVDITIQKIHQSLFAFSDEHLLFNNPHLLDGKPVSQIFRAGADWGMRLAKIADFFFTPQSISFIPCQSDYFPDLQAAVLSNVMTFWMEMCGLCTLHGAALTWQEQAFVLLAESTGGKSTLTASLLQNGASLMSDDISVIEDSIAGFHLRSGYPTMRLGFKQVEHFLGKQSEMAKLIPRLDKALIPIGSKGWAKFEPNTQVPATFYILKRKNFDQAPDIEILPLKSPDAVLALVQHSYVHHIPFLIGNSRQRLDFLAHLATQVPVKCLIFPSGYKYLPAVCAAIQSDLANCYSN